MALPADGNVADSLARTIGVGRARLELRRFPDGEAYLRYLDIPEAADLAIVCSLDRPDQKILPLLFAAAAARDLGAESVGLIAPYLAYMRQDRRFRPGEAVTSEHFARLISSHFDWLVTIDPHLHRHHALSEIYSIPTRVAHALPLVASWITKEVERPLLVGPDAESEQWVAATARQAAIPYIVLQKERHGDRQVEVTVPAMERWLDRTPVLVDDIISTGRTMIETLGHLTRAGLRPAVCIGIHGIFAERSYDQLIEAGAASVVTSNTIEHVSNGIDVTPVLATALSDFLAVPHGSEAGSSPSHTR